MGFTAHYMELNVMWSWESLCIYIKYHSTLLQWLYCQCPEKLYVVIKWYVPQNRESNLHPSEIYLIYLIWINSSLIIKMFKKMAPVVLFACLPHLVAPGSSWHFYWPYLTVVFFRRKYDNIKENSWWTGFSFISKLKEPDRQMAHKIRKRIIENRNL